jgi:hypothetical protein
MYADPEKTSSCRFPLRHTTSRAGIPRDRESISGCNLGIAVEVLKKSENELGPTKTDEVYEKHCTRFEDDLSAVTIFFIRFEDNCLSDCSSDCRGSS